MPFVIVTFPPREIGPLTVTPSTRLSSSVAPVVPAATTPPVIVPVTVGLPNAAGVNTAPKLFRVRLRATDPPLLTNLPTAAVVVTASTETVPPLATMIDPVLLKLANRAPLIGFGSPASKVAPPATLTVPAFATFPATARVLPTTTLAD